RYPHASTIKVGRIQNQNASQHLILRPDRYQWHLVQEYQDCQAAGNLLQGCDGETLCSGHGQWSVAAETALPTVFVLLINTNDNSENLAISNSNW
uniref:Uncharacterized protein n=1 Tax=Sciurus vulgaris TaxID=55149 RepID=A0A8D2AXX3_SCIVU